MNASRNGVAMKKIIDRIKEVTAGRSVKSVAEEIGLPQTSLNAYMTGRHKIRLYSKVSGKPILMRDGDPS